MANEVRYTPTFAMPSEYEQQAMEARRRRRMAEMLAAQAYQPQEGGVAPIPTAAPLVQGLQAFLTARQLKKAEEAEEKAREFDIEGFRKLREELGPREQIAAPSAVDIAGSVGMPQISEDGTMSYGQGAMPKLGMESVMPTAEERERTLENALFTGSPTARKYAELMMAQKPEREEFGTTPVMSETGEYVVFGKGGTARPTGVRGKPQETGMTPYQQAMLKLRERELGIRERATAPGTRPLSPTSQKELFETDENVLATQSGIGLLQNALDLSPKAFEGVAANQRAYAATTLPDAIEPEGAKETLEFDLLIKQQVLPQLRTIFGAAPTEGERAILLELQGSSNLPRKTRENLLRRAIDSANNRLQFNKKKAEQIRSGTYFSEGPMQQSTLPADFELE
jgi:hypothetical protein